VSDADESEDQVPKEKKIEVDNYQGNNDGQIIAQ
jgi:hypothetical protein